MGPIGSVGFLERCIAGLDLVQEDPQEFSPFSWSVDAVGNAVSFRDSSNVARVTVDAAGAGLDTSAALTVQVGSTSGGGDLTGDEVRLTGYAQPPSSVTLDGTASNAWSHDAQLGVVTLSPVDGALHTWIVAP